MTVTHAITAIATSAAASQGHDAGFALGAGPFISPSPSASTCATWPPQSSTGKHGCGPLPHCVSSASPSPRHLLPTTLVLEGGGLPQASKEGSRLQGSFSFGLQPQFHKPANGLGAAGPVLLPGTPSINRCDKFVGKADCAGRISARRRTTGARAFSSNVLSYCVFHSLVIRYSGLKNKRPADALEPRRQA